MLLKPTFRKLTTSDLTDFFALRLGSLLDSPNTFVASYEEEKQIGAAFYEPILNHNTQNIIIGAFLDNKLIGFTGIYQEEKKNISHIAKLWGMYVHPNYRNQNIGKGLLKMTINYAKNTLHCKKIDLIVVETNVRAKKLYELFNFKAWGIEPKAYFFEGNYYSAVHMYLIL